MSGRWPASLGKYDIRGTVGRGAMGVVYDGYDPIIDRRVAIKTLRLPDTSDPELLEGLERFRREARAAGRLSHPNIVAVYDYGETDELAYIVMEFVEGRSLKEWLAEHPPMPAGEAVALLREVLAGLAYSHDRGVVHRDIKPANIMMTTDHHAKIADFGIARIEASGSTQVGTIMGTPAYMSPEQFTGDPVDRRTDLYSCGVLLYQLLTGARPFDGSQTAIMHKVLTTAPPLPSSVAGSVPPALDAVVARAMARRPEDRFASAADFLQALRAPVADHDDTIIAPPVRRTAGSAGAPPPGQAGGSATAMAARPAHHLVWQILVILVVCVASSGLTVWLWPRRPAAPAPQQVSLVEPPAPATSEEAPVAAPPPAPVLAEPTPATSEEAAVVAPPPAPAMPPPDLPATPSPPSTAPTPASPVGSGATVMALLQAAPCSFGRATAGADGAVVLTGLVGAGAPEAGLRDSIVAATQAPIIWRIASFDGPYCPVLDLLRPHGAGSGMVLHPTAGGTSLRDTELIRVRVTMPGFAGFLHIADLHRDGTVSPLAPARGIAAPPGAAGTDIGLGDPRGDFAGWPVEPPFGTDLIIAVAGSQPLFDQPLPAHQPVAAYLAALRQAIDALTARGGRVAAAAMLLETRAADEGRRRPAVRTEPAAAAKPRNPRCSAILDRAQLGELPSEADRAFLRAECR